MKNANVLMKNITEHSKSEGVRKLNAVKTPTIKILENIKLNEFERLRRVKSTEILEMSRTMGNYVNSKQSTLDIQKARCKTMYFPFIN